MSEWLFDRNGNASAILDRDCVRSNSGDVISWISDQNVYSLNGNHIGWFDRGVIYDSDNDVLGFTRNATGPLPSRPGLSETPSIQGFSGRPGRPSFGGVPGRPGYGGWSKHDLKQYLKQN
ncbi:MAG: Uncharacterized protein FD156_1464 [Nitrospirae bacterium]|nr:MAG: Uncharacterized protein FD156_1464 [Nitrospirota bacterium]